MTFDMGTAKRLREGFRSEVSQLKRDIQRGEAPMRTPIKDALAEALEGFDSDTIADFILDILEREKEAKETVKQAKRDVVDSLRSAIHDLADNLDEYL